MRNLIVYRASAGSGKTFKLTQEYLSLILKNTDKYKHILAVTFTNKATDEMKGRILEELYLLAYSPKSKYMDLLQYNLKMNESQIREAALINLKKILFNYSNFRITTIDSFFQSIVKSFTAELGLQEKYKLELDREVVLEDIYKKIISDLVNNKQLVDWLVNMSQHNIDKGKGWDFEKDVKKFAANIFEEDFFSFEKDIITTLQEKDKLGEIKKEIDYHIANFEGKLEQIAQKAIQDIENQGLSVNDFSYNKSGIVGFFYKIEQKKDYKIGVRVKEGLYDIQKWVSKNTKNRENIIEFAQNHLQEPLNQIVNYLEDNILLYNSMKEINRFFYAFGLLADFAERLSDYRKENNVLLISDLNRFLHTIVGENEAPFIYEKAGVKYHNFLIDEFQDTSRFQWNNFVPLLKNSLANGNLNLIVGDLKQAIYRWRGGDQNLLTKGVEEEIGENQIIVKSLNINWRSNPRIIDFNNLIFEIAPKLLQNQYDKNKTQIKDAYSDSFQDKPKYRKKSEKEGKVEVSFFEGKEKDFWVNKLITTIEKLFIHNYKPKDITILVRNKNDGNSVAQVLMKHASSGESRIKNFKLISSESLFVHSAVTVKFIVSILRYLKHPEDQINLIVLVKNYLNLQNYDNQNFNDYILNNKNNNYLKEILPDIFFESIEKLKFSNLFDVVEEIIKIFQLSSYQSEIVYLHSFQDIVLDFINEHISDIILFLDWWETDGIQKTIQFSEEVDAINIMSIHKSKGLDFKIVIIPNLNWNIDHSPTHNNIIWVKNNLDILPQISVFPLKYVQKLTETKFREKFLQEKLAAYMDNLNLLYVATTRAVEGMYIFAPLPVRKQVGIKKISDLMFEILSSDYDNSVLEIKKYWNEEENIFSIGQLEYQQPKNIENHSYLIENYITTSKPLKLKKQTDKIESQDYDKEVLFKLNYGIFMHEILSNIYTDKDIQRVIDNLFYENKISYNQKDTLKRNIEKIINFEDAKCWFSDLWEVKTEQPILKKEGDFKVPDRVITKDDQAIVIDFKFGKTDEKHKLQLWTYMNLLEEIGYKKVQGYIYYPDKPLIIKC